MVARLLPYLLLVLQPLVFFGNTLFTQKTSIPFDIHTYHQPLTDFVAHCVRHGEFPLWDPNPYCGYPIVADLTAHIFYPPAWLAVGARLLSEPGSTLYWLEWLTALHLILAGVLAYQFLRRLNCGVAAALFGATTYQLGTFFASQTQHLGAICAAAWMPLVWGAVYELRFGFRRRWFALLTLGLALTFLSGFPAQTLVTASSAGILAVVLWLSRQARFKLLFLVPLAALASVPLIAVQLVPTLSWTPYAHAGVRGEWDLSGIPWRGLWTFFIPNFHNSATPFDPSRYVDSTNFVYFYWYCGLAAIVFLGVAIVRGNALARLFAGLALVFMVLQCAKFTPGLPALAKLLPGMIRGSLYAEFYLAAFGLAVALAAALGLNRFQGPWLAVVPLFAAVDLIYFGSNHPMNTSPAGWRDLSSEVTFVNNREAPQLIQRLIRTQTPPLRVDAAEPMVEFSQSTSLRRIPTPNGDNAFGSLRAIEVRRLFAPGHWWQRYSFVQRFDSPLLDYLNVGFLFFHITKEDPAALAQIGWSRVESPPWLRIYRNAEVAPRFYLVPSVLTVSSPAESLESLKTLDFRHQAVVEGGRVQAQTSGTVRLISYRNNSFSLETESVGPSYLVTSETWAPGWHATVDGVRQPILLTNHAFRGLAVPAGTHTVAFSYDPPGWIALLALSTLSFAVCLWAARK